MSNTVTLATSAVALLVVYAVVSHIGTWQHFADLGRLAAVLVR